MGAATAIKHAPSQVFYGWWVAMTSALGLFLGPIPIAIFSFGVFLKPLSGDLHVGRGTVSLAHALASLALALGAPLAGRLIDRFGPRRVILPSTVLAGLILLSVTVSSARLWQLYLFYSALGLVISGVSPVCYSHVVTCWFDRRRGLALGVAMFGLGLGALAIPSLAQVLIDEFGWRGAFGLLGAGVLMVAFPVVARFLKDRPEEIGLAAEGSAASSTPAALYQSGLRWNQAGRDGTFWLLFCSFLLVSAGVQACLTHVSSILSDRGAGAQTAAFATSLFGGGVLLGRTGTGYLLDRFFAPRVAATIFGSAAAGIGLLAVAASQELAFLAAFFIGLGLGAEVDIMAYLTSRYFGLRAFGSIYGFIFAGFGLAGGSGAYFMGAAFDASGSYRPMLAIFCVATFTGALLMLCVGPYRYQPGTAVLDARAAPASPGES
jgi:MFS family permease